ncbi:MAG: RluA family pseudouridine synthase [Thermoanaerobaculales bacterium]|nr:RluA family pseudouridine synthase [Thermoanaerobaculales bacterium]
MNPTRRLVRSFEAGQRLDVFLAGIAGFSRRRARSIISEGKVWRNGQPTRVQSRVMEAGDVIELLTSEIENGDPPWRPQPVTFVHEDPWLVVVNKPTGVLTQKAEGGGRHDMPLDERVLLNLALREGRRPFLRTIHRIDRLTSGLVVFARAPQALPPLDRAWRSGKVQRLYLAVVAGKTLWQDQEVDAPIGRDVRHNWRFRVDDSGRSAKTRVHVIQRGADSTVVVCELLTGRTHQVRVHLTHLGHPVLGDRLYGGGRTDIERPLLHAWALALPHPKDGRRLQLEAPPPEALMTHLVETDLVSPWEAQNQGVADDNG